MAASSSSSLPSYISSPRAQPPPHELFHENRRRVIANLVSKGCSPDGAYILMKGDTASHRHKTDVDLAFRQESNFWHISGCPRPELFLMVALSNGFTTLFAPELDAEALLWKGGIPLEEYGRKYPVDRVISVEKLQDELLKTKAKLIFVDNSGAFGPSCALRFPKGCAINKHGLTESLFTSRMVKSEHELHQMRVASAASRDAHIALIKSCKPGMYEYELESLFLHETKRRGCGFQAYMPIVASGRNASILHYMENQDLMKDGDLLLVDAGCECNGYASDITRTYPINGKFTDLQRDLYNVVLQTQEMIVSRLKPGVLWDDMMQLATVMLMEGMIRLGYLKGTVQEMIEYNIAGVFFPHGLGHRLGREVHDGSPYSCEPSARSIKFVPKESTEYGKPLKAGEVVTVEPGIYFHQTLIERAIQGGGPEVRQRLNMEMIAAANGLGIRIEDDVLITADGHENLSISVPKRVEEIEALMASQ